MKLRFFLTKKKSDLVHYLRNDSWLLKLRYLSDLLDKLNEVFLSLQGESTNVFTLKCKIEAFIEKFGNKKLKMINLKCSHLQKSFWLTMKWNQNYNFL